MGKTIGINRSFLVFGLPILLLVCTIFMSNSKTIETTNYLDLAVTIDLLITIPLVYFLLIRKSSIPKTTVVPVMIIGLVVGSYFLPDANQFYLSLFKTWALPFIELFLLSFVIIKVRKTIKTFKHFAGHSPDFFDALKMACSQILPKRLVSPFATEIAVFYYGFINWHKQGDNERSYSYHKENGAPALFGALIMVILVETVALHFLLYDWSPVFTWVLSGLSLYTALQFFGFARGLSKRPIQIENDILRLRYSFMNESLIPLKHILKIELTNTDLEKDQNSKKLSPLGDLESHNIILTLSEPTTLIGIYGIKKQYQKIAFHVDKPVDFKRDLERALEDKNV
ncbi:hypothetical protein [Crocinitomix algicola]|uniref:hypothetical protein n=1 Tax=Crocinitomix algicola TaxID=1740263 RepID=UPI000834A150|nr:hypothetical protein [Crocinitomix algicola]